jgi:hypothetical protein
MYLLDRNISSSQDEPRQAFSGMSTRVHGLAESTCPDPKAILAQYELIQRRNFLRERRDFEQTVQAIAGDLSRWRRGHFVQGSPQTSRLVNLFKSIPSSHARNLLCRLLDVNDPLGKLFDDKVAPPTRNAMLQILCQI